MNSSEAGQTIKDALRPKTPKSAVTLENIDKVHDIVLAHRRVEVRVSAEAINILFERVHFISRHELHIRKL